MENQIKATAADLREYLLGDLPAEKVETIDLQILADENLEEELWSAENDLIEDYLDETLSPAEVRAFERNFLVAPERLAQIKQITILRNYARRAASEVVGNSAEEASASANRLAKLKDFLSRNWRPLSAATALIVIGTFTVFYLTASRQTAAEKEYTAINQQNLSDLTALSALASLSLTRGIYRDGGGVGKLFADRLTEKVFFRLALPVQSEAADKFKAELIKNEKVEFMLDDLPFYQNPNGQEMRLLLPAAELKRGAYQIRLIRKSAPESTFIYHFTVE